MEKVHYDGQDTPGEEIAGWEAADARLCRLDPHTRSYAVFSLADGAYIQCAGSKQRLTVEYRRCESDGTFRHYVLGRGPLRNRTRTIRCAVGPIDVDESQVLDLEAARLLIRTFLEAGTVPEGYTSQEVTDRFREPHEPAHPEPDLRSWETGRI